MSVYVEFELPSGGSFLVEAENSHQDVDGELVQAGRNKAIVIKKAEESFENAIDNIKNVADLMLAKFKSLHEAPDEIEVLFGLKASGEMGGQLVFAKASMEANYTVTLKWKRNKSTEKALDAAD